MKTGLTIVAFVGIVSIAVLGTAPPADCGVISYIMLNPDTADADTGLDPENDYTHLLDFGTVGPATVNGVEFTQVTVGNIDAIPGFSYTVNSGARSGPPSGSGRPAGAGSPAHCRPTPRRSPRPSPAPVPASRAPHTGPRCP